MGKRQSSLSLQNDRMGPYERNRLEESRPQSHFPICGHRLAREVPHQSERTATKSVGANWYGRRRSRDSYASAVKAKHWKPGGRGTGAEPGTVSSSVGALRSKPNSP